MRTGPCGVNQKCERAQSVFLGTDLSLFDRLAEGNRRFGKPGGEIELAYIGTLGYSYDLNCVIDALKLLRDRGVNNIRFVVIGDGPLRSRFEAYAQAQGVRADFMGRLDYGEMAGLLVSCDIAVNPIRGGSPSTILNKHGDYAAAGLPVINTQESPEYKSLIEAYECGINCGIGSAQDVAGAIERLASDAELRRQMGRNSRRLAKEKFDRKQTYRAILTPSGAFPAPTKKCISCLVRMHKLPGQHAKTRCTLCIEKRNGRFCSLNILHYAGIGANPSSGIRVIVPQMLSAQAGYATVGFYNYAQSCLKLDSRIADYSRSGHSDYRRFPRQFDRPDLVLFHSPFGIPSCCAIARQLDRQSIPYVVVPHGSFTRAALGIHRLKKALALRTWMRQLVKNAAAVQFLSDGEMGASAYNAKGIVIPNGIALHAYEYREVSQVKKFLFIGRKDPVHKGIDVLVEACAKIKRELEKKRHSGIPLRAG